MSAADLVDISNVGSQLPGSHGIGGEAPGIALAFRTGPGPVPAQDSLEWALEDPNLHYLPTERPWARWHPLEDERLGITLVVTGGMIASFPT